MSLHLSHIWFSIEGHQLPFLQHAHTIFGWTCSILTNLVFWEMQERKSEDHHWLCSTFAFIMFNHQRKSWGNLESVKIYFWVVKHTLSSVVKINILTHIIWIEYMCSPAGAVAGRGSKYGREGWTTTWRPGQRPRWEGCWHHHHHHHHELIIIAVINGEGDNAHDEKVTDDCRQYQQASALLLLLSLPHFFSFGFLLSQLTLPKSYLVKLQDWRLHSFYS